MEAPKKIYLHPDIGGKEFIRPWLHKAANSESVEYICKDVFIEKACDAYCKVCGHYPHSVPTYICRQDCDYYSDFKAQIEKLE